MLDRDRFTQDDVRTELEAAVGAITDADLGEILMQLRLSGFLRAEQDIYFWAIPLLREVLQKQNREADLARLLQEYRAG